ncbi:unnamed protein product [Blepharisma stoltei]|uniref:Checkpoint protein n=1 Tax=Blepharisma stoltei TaxID=1481888 RepID=A0AAU9J2U0_9CILI|nr:unnamed protein product [Blepharisma stoltei]
MEPQLFSRISKIELLLSILASLKAIKNQRLLMVFQKERAYFLSASPSHDLVAEGYLSQLEFDIYNVIADIEIMVDIKGLRSVLKALSAAENTMNLTMEYPYKDNKLLLMVEETNSYSTQFCLDTYMVEPQPVLELSDKINATIKFNDPRIIKQAMEVACYGRNEIGIFLSFNVERPYCFFTRDDNVTGIKSRVAIPLNDQIDCKVSQPCEKMFSSKLLRNVAGLPKCSQVEMIMHEEGVLEVRVILSNDAWIRHFINPTEERN